MVNRAMQMTGTNKAKFKTLMLQSDLCDYSDAYIVVKGKITVRGANNRDIKDRPLLFKNNFPFIGCISRVSNVLIDNVEDLDVVMSMCRLIEFSKNYRKTMGSLWNYYRDEPNNPPADNCNAGPITNSTSIKYKISITGKTSNNDNGNDNTKYIKILVPLNI